MKQVLMVITLILSVVFATAETPTVQAQSFELPLINSTSMKDIYLVGAKLVGALEEDNQEIVHIEYDIVNKDIATTTFRVLTSTWNYKIIGFADFRVADLDITVYRFDDSVWVPVIVDQLADNVPMVDITPKETQRYRIDVSAYRFKKPYSSAHYGLFIYHVQP